jgi:hypothetical protein
MRSIESKVNPSRAFKPAQPSGVTCTTGEDFVRRNPFRHGSKHQSTSVLDI